MNNDLTDIPFDHYQRYASAAAIVQAVLPQGGSVLEVGANRQRLLGQFLPGHSLLYSDIEPQDGADFVVADACALPFQDAQYGAVVSLDVLEHIPARLRRAAISEMGRVASRVVVICCPTDRRWVHEAEQSANAIWRSYMGGDYPWLAEHQECGLVEPSEVEEVLRESGLRVRRIGQGDPLLWSTLMGAHFSKEAVAELAPFVAALDRFYNREIFWKDFGDRSYRDVFIGLRDERDLEAINTTFRTVGPAAGADPRAMLTDAVSSLQPVLVRLVDAERQWSATATLHADTQRRLADESQARHEAGLQLRAAESRAVEQYERAERADGRVRELEQAVQSAEQRAAEQFDRGERADEQVRTLEQALRAAEYRAAEQFDRAESADGATRAVAEELRSSEMRAVEQLLRADAADRRLVELELEHAGLREHGDRLAARLFMVQQRLRWTMVGSGLGVALVGVACFVLLR